MTNSMYMCVKGFRTTTKGGRRVDVEKGDIFCGVYTDIIDGCTTLVNKYTNVEIEVSEWRLSANFIILL